jgi:hypothetical protein
MASDRDWSLLQLRMYETVRGSMPSWLPIIVYVLPVPVWP